MIDYNKPSIQLALDMINRKAGTTFRTRDVTLENITYLDEGVYNTEATITPVQGSAYQEPYTIQYDRVNIEQLFRGVQIKIVPAYQKKLSDYLPSLNTKYGLSLTEEDIVDGIIEAVDPPFTVEIPIKENNPAFYGLLTILITNEQMSIRKMVDGIDFAGIPFPTKDKSKIQAPLYFYDSDWTELSQLLSLYSVGTQTDEAFVNNINLYDTVIWIDSSHKLDFNLHHANVLYNGEIGEENEYTRRKDFTHILVVEPNEKYCRNLSGYLTFHYNLPEHQL